VTQIDSTRLDAPDLGTDGAPAPYDGSAPFPDRTPDGEPTGSTVTRAGVTILLVAGPFVALVLAVALSWGSALTWRDVALAVTLYVLTGLGITLGYHRGATHRAFRAKRPLGLTVAVGGAAVAHLGWRAVRGWPSGGDEIDTGRTRFMAVVGQLTGALFALVIGAHWHAVLMLPARPTGTPGPAPSSR